MINVVEDGAGGTADKLPGTASLTLPLQSRIYLTGLEDENNPDAGGFPCPRCQNGFCSAGARKGLACSTSSAPLVTHDCPPSDHLLLAPIGVDLTPLAAETVTKTASDLGSCGSTGCAEELPSCCSGDGDAFCGSDADCQGIFCAGQRQGGAFGQTQARSIIQHGSPVAGGLDSTAKDVTFASVFCIPATGSALIDGATNLPGPGAFSFDGTMRLQ